VAVKLTLAQLEALFWVARMGSVRAAAARLSITQPALSLRIKDLEAAIGGTLLNRSSYRATPTTFGLEVVRQAERMLDLAERIGDRAAPSSDIRGLVRLGATDTFAARFLPSLLADIETNHPQAQVELVVEFSVNLYAKLLRGELDVAVISGPTLSPLLAFERLMDLPHYWVGTPKRLGSIKIATPAALARIPIVTHPSPSLLFETIQAWFASAGLAPLRLSTCTSLFISKALTVEGIGLSLLPAEIIEPEVRAGTLRIVGARPAIPDFPMFVAYRRDASSANVRNFIARIRASVAMPSRPAISRGGRNMIRKTNADRKKNKL
jgi:DNA-binding transcriptional LysR family regulator